MQSITTGDGRLKSRSQKMKFALTSIFLVNIKVYISKHFSEKRVGLLKLSA